MPTPNTINILKEAILLERRGQAFYHKVANQADNPAVKAFFETMAQEEERHVEILESQFASYVQDQQFLTIAAQDQDNEPVAELVLSQEVKREIAAAEFEAAAIAAAVMMEERAVTLYSKRAETAQDPAEATLYLWLADWERGHLSFLARLDREIKEAVWNDNQFWPF
jgi:rubrerythrin